MKPSTLQLFFLFFFVYATEALAEIEIPTVNEQYGITIYPPVPDLPQFAEILWSDIKTFTVRINPRKNYLALSGIAATSAILIYYDQEITDKTQSFARKRGLLSDTKNGRETITLIDPSIGGLDFPLRLPTNTISTFYFLGDALTQISVMGAFAGYGALYDDERATNTSLLVLEGALVTAAVIQVLKRSFGRESPFERSEPGGNWDLLPNQIDYALHVSKYDAMPAGHMATAISTTHIIASQYPEYRFVKPVGYIALGLIGFGMEANGVHWAGDYPLGLAVGYLAAEVVIERARTQRQQYLKNKTSYYLLPTLTHENRPGISLLMRF